MPKKLKIIIVGETGVGKSNIILRIHKDIYKGDLASTCGLQYNSSTQKIQGNNVLVELWDTTGQQRYRKIVSNFFRGAQGVFIVGDITSIQSLQKLQFWASQLDAHLSENVPKILLLNKTDILQNQLQPEKIKIIEQVCTKYKLIQFKVSAKKGTNIKIAYKKLISNSYHYACQIQKNNPNQKKSTIIEIDSSNIIDKKKKKNCC